MRNADVAKLLEDIAAALELMEESAFKIRAYLEAARQVAYLTEDVEALCRENRLCEIPGFGESIQAKVKAYLKQGRSIYLEGLIKEIPAGVFELLKVPGIGPRKANALFRQLKVTSLQELADAAKAHRIRELPGMGEKTERSILKELGRLTERSTRLPLGVAWPLADAVAAMLRESDAVELAEPAGSIRRRKETIGDIDLLVASRDAEGVENAIKALPITQEILWRGPTKVTFLTHDQFQVDVRIVAPEVWGSALQHFTGSKAHNIALRERALKRGLRINEYGLFELKSGNLVAGRTEADIYAALELAWMPPELREAQSELAAAENGELPQLVTLEDIRGDFHAHTTYSDGEASLDEMARGAIARGYEYLVITDHSYGLGVTQGLTREKAAEQRRVIDKLNRKLAPFRILAGVELEIKASGALDFDDEVLALFDIVSASLHLGTQQDSERITARMVGALANPYVTILNHPSGRLFPRREPYEYNFEAIVEAAASAGKCLEINGSTERMDLHSAAAHYARDHGVMLSIGSDAHRVDGLDAMRIGVALARRAWLEPKDILNTLSLTQLLAKTAHPARSRGKKSV